MVRKYTGGPKRPMKKGRYSESRWAWTRNVIGQFIVLVYPKTDDMEPSEFGDGEDDITLYHAKDSGHKWAVELTRLTEEEFTALKSIIDSAFEEALPIIRRRDKVAQNAYNDGDNSYERSYRPIPQLVYRARPVGPHSQVVSK